MDENYLEPLIASFRQEIDEAAEKGLCSLERVIDSRKCVRRSMIDNSTSLKQAVKSFKKEGIALTFVRNDHESHFFIKEDYSFYATW